MIQPADTATDARPELPFLQILNNFVRSPSVVGCEAPFFSVLQRELEFLGVQVRAYSGVLEARGSKPGSLTISAHIDRHGILCTGPNEFQYAAFVTRAQGDLDGDSVSEQTVSTIADRFRDAPVEAYDPWHGGYLGQGTVADTHYCQRRMNLVFEIDGLDGLRPGTPVAYLQPLIIHPDRLAAQLDNVLTVALVVDMFRRGFEGTALFSVEEEAGRSWRYLLQWFRRRGLKTRRLLVMDTSPYPDAAAARQQQVVLRRQDANGAFAAEFVDEIASHCANAGATIAFKDEQVQRTNESRAADGLPPRSLGRTELGRLIAASDGAITGATFQLPTTGYHTPQETVMLDSVRAAIAVTDELIRA